MCIVIMRDLNKHGVHGRRSPWDRGNVPSNIWSGGWHCHERPPIFDVQPPGMVASKQYELQSTDVLSLCRHSVYTVKRKTFLCNALCVCMAR